ncbi:MAG TPA: PA2779 family protein [Thermoanaerobaculia bacterium]|nr:PA2779 family protein [Thermoanaerobaculia bacterium]
MVLISGLTLLLTALPALAGPAPSKTAADQTVTARQADLTTVRSALEIERVAGALEAQGFTAEQIDSRVAALSDDDLRALARNVEQIQAAGLSQEQWMWVGVGALAVLLLILLVD